MVVWTILDQHTLRQYRGHSLKLLLMIVYSEAMIFAKIKNFTRHSLKSLFFPGDFEDAKSLKNSENNSQGLNRNCLKHVQSNLVPSQLLPNS